MANLSRHTGKCQGFSLVELSIVLVILGLLIGGVLGGRSLIKSAELRSITKEYEQWNIALNVFKGKYRYLPGDINNATSFWTDTADGNGDGRIVFGDLGDGYGENYTFWQHLTYAGLISGDFSGKQGPLQPWHHIIGENTPQSKFSGGGWSVENTYGGDENRYDYNYRNAFLFGGQSSDGTTHSPVLIPEDAWNIDMKTDDGKPGSGKIVALFWDDACATATSNTDYNSDYNLSDRSIRCTFYFPDAIR